MNQVATGSLGCQLRRARTARGLSLEDVAVSTKVPRASLDALENDALTLLPAPVFVRGFVRAYAETVGLDPDDMVRQLPLSARTVNPPTAWLPAQTEAGFESGFSAPVRRPGFRSTQALLLLLAVGMLIAAWFMVGQQAAKSPMNVNEQPPAVHERVEGVSSFFDAHSIR